MPSGPSNTGGVTIASAAYTDRFKKDLKKYKKKDPDLYRDIRQAVQDLLQNPRRGYLRFEKLQGHEGIFTVHVRGNVKISMDIDGDHATLRRVGHHDTIDSNP